MKGGLFGDISLKGQLAKMTAPENCDTLMDNGMLSGQFWGRHCTG